MRDHPICELQRRHGIVVGARRAELARGLHDDRFRHLRSGDDTRDQPGHGDAVAADIENAAAAEVVGILTRGGIEGLAIAEGRLNQVNPADPAGLHEFDQLCRLRMQPIHEAFHQEDIMRTRGLDDRGSFGRVHAERLFAQNMLARLRSLDRPFGMRRVRCRDIDRVHLGIGEQGFVAPMQAGLAEGCIRRHRATAGDGGKARALGMGQGRGEAAPHAAGAENAPIQRHVHHIHLSRRPSMRCRAAAPFGRRCGTAPHPNRAPPRAPSRS